MTASTSLRLRPLRLEDEDAFRAAHRAMLPEGFEFGWAFDEGTSWSAYLERLGDERIGRQLPPGIVPATFLVAEVGGRVVGRTSVRHVLNDYLERFEGHIGYGVLAPYRRRGYATEILRQSLVIARSVGVGRVLVTCDEDNAGSAAVIEANGGRLDNVVPTEPGRPAKRRYWID
ncbi:GNAT family N-acetyltransferase [Amycolatopsis sp. NPDC059021]|uniref:GNAT family N-acetyltransferase n=1 Tax=Amycolatopsis sp. NPDC059021 TaxID=3346704 RepID=UPI00367050F7